MSGIKVVIYTDGGAEPPRGPGGSGLFGYTYSDTVDGPTDDQYHPTDKGYFSNLNVPKDAKWVQPIEYFEGMVSYPMAVTNNIAELGAAILAFELIRERGWKDVLIRPDSEYVRQNYLENLEKWRQNGWQTANHDPIANQQQWESLYQFKTEFARAEVKIDWRWVKGHSDDPGNQRADQIATQGKQYAMLAKASRTVKFTDAAPVERGETIKVPGANKMLAMPRWYFTNDSSSSQQLPDGRWVYYGGSHGKDDELFAKPMADSTYCVCFLKDADPVMESIREKQYKLNENNYCEMVIGHLDNILNSRVYNSLFVNGTRWLDPCPGTNDLMYGGDQLLTRELTKPRLALNAIDTLVKAEDLLKNFLAGTLADVHVREVTDDFYDVEEKKGKISCKLKKEIDSATKTIPVKLDYKKADGTIATLATRAVLGQDLPRRNTLSHLASKQPKMHVLSWSNDPNSLFFATVLVAEEDATIWMGYPANYRVIPKE